MNGGRRLLLDLCALTSCSHPTRKSKITMEVFERVTNMLLEGNASEIIASKTQMKKYANTLRKLIQGLPRCSVQGLLERRVNILIRLLLQARGLSVSNRALKACREDVGIRGGRHAEEYLEICAALLDCQAGVAIVCSGRTFDVYSAVNILRGKDVQISTEHIWPKRGKAPTFVCEVRKERA